MGKKKQQGQYLPLRFANSIAEYPPGTAFSSVTKVLRGVCTLPDDLEEEEYVNFLSSSNFLDPSYRGRLASLNRYLIENMDSIRNRLNDVNPNWDAVTEMKDVCLYPVLLDRWVKYKQVYRIDKDFADALLSSEDIFLSREMLRRLPYKSFYIDLEKCERFAPTKGLFVNIFDITETSARFVVYLTTEDLLFFSQYLTINFDEKGISSDIAANYKEHVPYLTSDGRKINDSKVERTRVSLFALQLISYLTSKEPDIESDPTASGAKPFLPGTRIKNKFSEISRHEIGVRVGNRIRVALTAMAKANSTLHSHGTTRRGTPKIPHVRAAHWSHYWTGPGRTVYETRWIEPVFVNCNADEQIDVVLHDVG